MSNFIGKLFSLDGLIFGLFSLIFGVVLYSYLADTLNVDSRYITYLLSLNVIIFILYGIDKLSPKFGGRRIPEPLLHLLALLGGFVGGWLGMFVWVHKTNWAKHQDFPIFLTIATLLHGAIIYFLFFQGV